MKKLIIISIFLFGCAASNHELSYDQKTTQLLCSTDVCDSFARQHDYTLLETTVTSNNCRCHLQSSHMPDAFTVSLPVHNK